MSPFASTFRAALGTVVMEMTRFHELGVRPPHPHLDDNCVDAAMRRTKGVGRGSLLHCLVPVDPALTAPSSALAASEESLPDTAVLPASGQWRSLSRERVGLPRGSRGIAMAMGRGRRLQGAGIEGWGAADWGMRGDAGEGEWFIHCIHVGGMVLGSWVMSVMCWRCSALVCALVII